MEITNTYIKTKNLLENPIEMSKTDFTECDILMTLNLDNLKRVFIDRDIEMLKSLVCMLRHCNKSKVILTRLNIDFYEMRDFLISSLNNADFLSVFGCLKIIYLLMCNDDSFFVNLFMTNNDFVRNIMDIMLCFVQSEGFENMKNVNDIINTLLDIFIKTKFSESFKIFLDNNIKNFLLSKSSSNKILLFIFCMLRNFKDMFLESTSRILDILNLILFSENRLFFTLNKSELFDLLNVLSLLMSNNNNLDINHSFFLEVQNLLYQTKKKYIIFSLKVMTNLSLYDYEFNDKFKKRLFSLINDRKLLDHSYELLIYLLCKGDCIPVNIDSMIQELFNTKTDKKMLIIRLISMFLCDFPDHIDHVVEKGLFEHIINSFQTENHATCCVYLKFICFILNMFKRDGKNVYIQNFSNDCHISDIEDLISRFPESSEIQTLSENLRYFLL